MIEAAKTAVAMVILLALNLVPAARADEPASGVGPGFKGTGDLEGVVQIASGFSADKQAVTVLFRNLDAQVWGKTGPLVSSRTLTATLPLSKNDKDVNVTQDVRGFVSRQNNARATLVVQAAGRTTIVNLDKARNVSGGPNAKTQANGAHAGRSGAKSEAQRRAREQAKNLPALTSQQGDMRDFTTRIEGTVPAGSHYTVTFFLLVERPKAAEGSSASLVIDSLDVELQETASK